MGKTDKRRWSFIGMLAVSSVIVLGTLGTKEVLKESAKTGTEAVLQENGEYAEGISQVTEGLDMMDNEPGSVLPEKEELQEKREIWIEIKTNIENVIVYIKDGLADIRLWIEEKRAGNREQENSVAPGNSSVSGNQMDSDNNLMSGIVEESGNSKDSDDTIGKNGETEGSTDVHDHIVSSDTGQEVTNNLPSGENVATGEGKVVQMYTADVSYFDDALFLGDSRTVGLHEYGDLGKAEVIADSGMSVYKITSDTFAFESGEKGTLEELLSVKQFGKVYIMLGINELGYDFEQTIKKYKGLVEMIQNLQPDSILFLEANLHISGEKSEESDIYNNTNIDRINQAVAEMADGEKIFYLDVNELFDDEEGNLSTEYTSDHSHVLGKYYADWVQWILEHGVRE